VELREVVVYTRDMERATAFYRDVLGLQPDFESPYWTTFRTGACTFALHAGQKPRIPPSRSSMPPLSASGSSQRASR
jgi:catechol 2,3-dioxygenase-like lactoylglutathione lyase family enzyme